MNHPDIETLSDLGAIAVIGMSGEFSGCSNIDEFWSLIQSGQSAGRHTAPETAKEMGMPSGKADDEHYVPWSMPIEDVDQFDARAFDMSDMQAETMDPQCRRFLQSCWLGLEQAGYNPMKLRALNAGIVACSNPNGYLGDTVSAHLDANHHAKALQILTGNSNDFLATWAAYKLNLTGPALTVQTACSSSLVAIANACLQLQTYQADLMIAGGAALSLPQDLGYVRQPGSILSENGQCSPFSVEASGTLNGHAVATVILKRVEDAVADGDHIWAVIRGAGINNDGRAKMDFMAPGVEGQSAVMQKALQLADLSPDQVQYIETHGTGTQLGDEIEVRALSRVYGRDKTTQYLGAVKSNIGHANAGAGIAGFIKTVLSLYHGKIAPNAGITRANPALKLDDCCFALPRELMDWPLCERRRAAISSLGFGGTNAHLILEQAPSLSRAVTGPVEQPSPVCTLTLSGTSDASLKHQLSAWQTWLKEKTPSLSELQGVADALKHHRHHFKHRVAVVGDSWQALDAAISGQGFKHGANKLVLAFTGQGAQWPGMGREIYQKDKVFQSVTHQCDAILESEWGITPASEVWQGKTDFDLAFSHAGGAHYYQFCYQLALGKALTARGIEFDCVIGHSLGEFAAAVFCEALSLEQAVWLVCQRGMAIENECTESAGMLAVNIKHEALIPLLPDTLDLSVVNSEQQCVVSGSEIDLEAFKRKLESLNHQCKRLKTTHGFHSRQMKAASDTFRFACERVEYRPVKGHWISALTGQKLTHIDADYWVAHMTDTVRFDLVLDQLRHQDMAIIESGGRSILSALIQPVLKQQAVTTTFSANEEDKLMAEAEAIAFCSDRLKADNTRRSKGCILVPNFDRTRYWSEQASHRVLWQQKRQELHGSSAQVEEDDDELTLWLKSLWHAELGDKVSIHSESDFYALGGNSLAAIQICDQLEKQLGLSFPISQFLDQRTFGQFMETLMTLAEEQTEETESIQ